MTDAKKIDEQKELREILGLMYNGMRYASESADIERNIAFYKCGFEHGHREALASIKAEKGGKQ